MKVSKTQLEILKLMANGWELGRDAALNRDWWIQKGGLGKGGEAKNIRITTGYSLYNKGLIYKPNPKPEFPTEHWALTEKGKEAAESL